MCVCVCGGVFACVCKDGSKNDSTKHLNSNDLYFHQVVLLVLKP